MLLTYWGYCTLVLSHRYDYIAFNKFYVNYFIKPLQLYLFWLIQRHGRICAMRASKPLRVFLIKRKFYWCTMITSIPMYIYIYIYIYRRYGPVAKTQQCTSPISHNAPHCSITFHTCGNFCHKVVWCIVRFVRWEYSSVARQGTAQTVRFSPSDTNVYIQQLIILLITTI